MPQAVQNQTMSSGAVGLRYAVPAVYAGIAVVAYLIDLFTDRSGGSFSLATLPTALLAACCFVVGQVTAKNNGNRYLSDWLLGAVLVFLGLVVFAMRGGDAPKDGEQIFTYAMLLAAPPASFVLPLAPSPSTGHALGDVLLRSVIGWSFCVAMGVIQWISVRWLMRRLRKLS
jgi:hypothetical protein